MFHAILEWSIRGLLMAAGTGLVVRLLRLRTASALHQVWTAAMVAMLLLPAWTQWGPRVTAPVLPAEIEQGAPMVSPVTGLMDPQNFAGNSDAAARPLSRPAPARKRVDWQTILTAVYLAGVAAMLARLIAGTLQIGSTMRLAREADGFATSPGCAAPITIGWLRPRVVLPEDWQSWPASKLDAVLIHEREHARRRDPLVQWLALLNRCVFWFHPLAWWLERKLAALSEQACDEAVLLRGHDAHDYSQYLIELARSVQQRGARIRTAGAVAFSDGNLPGRIRRILSAQPGAGLSRKRLAASAVLCALVLAAVLVYELGPRRTRQPQLTMQEQDDRARAEMNERRQQQSQTDSAIWEAAKSLTPAGARQLEAEIKAHPEALKPMGPKGRPEAWDKLLELVRYYQAQKDLASLNALAFWFIEQHADKRLNWGYQPEWDRAWDSAGYDRGRQLWEARLQQPVDSPYVFMNAAEFLAEKDPEQAEQILLRGQQKYPAAALHWEVFLANLYAWALSGSPRPLTAGYSPASASQDQGPAQTPYAQKVRSTLLALNDVELLTSMAEKLQGSRGNVEFALSLLERAISIHPDDASAHSFRFHYRLLAASERSRKDPGRLSESDRMLLLEANLEFRSLPKDETQARELLSLATRNPSDPDAGTGVYLANMALGTVSMNRGDHAAAVKYLLAAAKAPATGYLEYHQLDMSLARGLVDAGERDAVATYLDRVAAITKLHNPYAQWAKEIRHGGYPELRPHWNLFAASRKGQ